MIGSDVGGTGIEGWTTLDGFKKNLALAGHVEKYAEQVGYLKNFYKERYEKELAEWNRFVAEQAGSPGKAKPDKSYLGDDYGNTCGFFNGMTAPIIPYAIKWVIWYQGEANDHAPKEYAKLFPALITDWRMLWNQGEFPFLFVQLANHMAAQRALSEPGWSQLRKAQLQTLSVPNTGMAVTIDVGDSDDIHPRDKADVAHRLALAARHLAYGENQIYSGPIYKSMVVEGNHIRLTFSHVGGGLKMDVPPWNPKKTAPPAPTELTGFAIAGKDEKFVWGKAMIDGNTIVVSNNEIPQPVSVRYNWANSPFGNLYNKEALPASPFRTDTWQTPDDPMRR